MAVDRGVSVAFAFDADPGVYSWHELLDCRCWILIGSLSRQLDEFGFVVVDQLADTNDLKLALQRAMLSDGDPGTPELRIRGLLNSSAFEDASNVERLLLHPLLMELAAQVLGDDFRIAEIGVRWMRPGAQGLPLHVGFPADWLSAASIPIPSHCFVLTYSWILSEITASNGVRVFVPGSHRVGTAPQPEDHDPYRVYVTAKAGSLIVFNSAVWHGIMPNSSPSDSRIELGSAYCMPWIDRRMASWTLSTANALEQVSERLRLLHSADPLE